MCRETGLVFLSSLLWIHSGLATRVSIFPSWSWAGWSGQLSPHSGDRRSFWSDPLHEDVLLPANHDVYVWIGNEDSTVTTFPGWESLPDFLSGRSQYTNRFIYIEADTIEISPVRFTESFLKNQLEISEEEYNFDNFHKQYYAQFQIKEDKLLYFNLNIKVDEERAIGFQSKDRKFTGILLGNDSYLHAPVVLVVEEMQEWAERLTVFAVSDCELTSRNGVWSTIRHDHRLHRMLKRFILNCPKTRRQIRLG
jgi:hypothetical protein